MSVDDRDSIVVLVVEDERNLADLYAKWLSETYEVRTAYDGDAAMDQMDERVDVVLLDRRLPGMSGDEFLEYVRENDYDCQVAMVSAVDPDFDIVEMGFDDYVVKPVDREELRGVVERLLRLDAVGNETQTYFARIAKRDALQGEKNPQELAESEEYAALLSSIESFERNVLSLAEQYLSSSTGHNTSDDKKIYQTGIQEWKQRQREVSENDPLYRTAAEQIRRYEALLAETKDDSAVEREFLEVVAEGFVADGFWLDSRIRRALNDIFFDKLTDSLVIERKRLEPGNDLTPEQLFEISQTVRQKAASRLDSMS